MWEAWEDSAYDFAYTTVMYWRGYDTYGEGFSQFARENTAYVKAALNDSSASNFTKLSVGAGVAAANFAGSVPLGLTDWGVAVAGEIPNGPEVTVYRFFEVPVTALIGAVEYVGTKAGDWWDGSLSGQDAYTVANEVTTVLLTAYMSVTALRHMGSGISGGIKGAARIIKKVVEDIDGDGSGLVPAMASSAGDASLGSGAALLGPATDVLGDFAKGIVFCASRVDRWARHRAMVERMKALSRGRKYSEVERLLLELIEIEISLAGRAGSFTLNRLGWVLEKLGRYSEAESVYLKSLEIDLDQKVLNELAHIYRRTGRFDLALSTARKSIGMGGPRMVYAYTEEAAALRMLGEDLELALAEVEKGIAIDDSNYAVPHYEKVLILYKMGRYVEALEAANRTLEVMGEVPRFGSIFCKKARILRHLKRYEGAFKTVNEGIKKLPGWKDRLLSEKALLLWEMGEQDAALNVINEAIAFNGKGRRYALKCKGAMLREMGDLKGSLAVLDEAVSLKDVEEFSGIWYERAKTLWRMWEYDKAVPDMQRAIEFYDDDLQTYQVEMAALKEERKWANVRP